MSGRAPKSATRKRRPIQPSARGASEALLRTAEAVVSVQVAHAGSIEVGATLGLQGPAKAPEQVLGSPALTVRVVAIATGARKVLGDRAGVLKRVVRVGGRARLEPRADSARKVLSGPVGQRERLVAIDQSVLEGLTVEQGAPMIDSGGRRSHSVSVRTLAMDVPAATQAAKIARGLSAENLPVAADTPTGPLGRGQMIGMGRVSVRVLDALSPIAMIEVARRVRHLTVRQRIGPPQIDSAVLDLPVGPILHVQTATVPVGTLPEGNVRHGGERVPTGTGRPVADREAIVSGVPVLERLARIGQLAANVPPMLVADLGEVQPIAVGSNVGREIVLSVAPATSVPLPVRARAGLRGLQEHDRGLEATVPALVPTHADRRAGRRMAESRVLGPGREARLVEPHFRARRS